MANKDKTFLLNTLSTHWLFDYLLNENGNFLFISTSELYSGLDYPNITEEQIGTTNPSHPRASYIEGKRGGETICHSMIDKGYNVKIVRLALGYGPGTKKNDQRVLNSLIQKGLFNDKIELMDAGDAIRTYCYVTDVVEMIYNILLNGKEVVYNVGGESITTILDLAKLIGEKLNKQVVTPELTNELTGNPKVVNISTEKYKNEFNKKTFISLEEGIINTINWQKELYGKNN
jgi:nucleoside-diphosphate-sugar epimerase